MPKRLGSTLLFLTLLSFPFRLLAGGVIQTENFTYPLTGNRQIHCRRGQWFNHD